MTEAQKEGRATSMGKQISRKSRKLPGASSKKDLSTWCLEMKERDVPRRQTSWQKMAEKTKRIEETKQRRKQNRAIGTRGRKTLGNANKSPGQTKAHTGQNKKRRRRKQSNRRARPDEKI